MDLKAIKNKIANYYNEYSKNKKIRHYNKHGKIPWSVGYNEYKWDKIRASIYKDEFTKPPYFGKNLDERIVEYPWIINNLHKFEWNNLLDAGSSLNHEIILNHPVFRGKQLTIYTYFPEGISFANRRINYFYEDLKNIPIIDNYFDVITCISTIEHIDMDNSMYGYTDHNLSDGKTKSYGFIKVIKELLRVLKHEGKLFITFPFGKWEYHGFFQQFDVEMVNKLREVLRENGKEEIEFYKYEKEGWIKSNMEMCKECESFNPHTGKGAQYDGAAHSRAICCLKFDKE